MDPISNRPLSALDSTVSFKTVSTSNKPNPLPEDIRLRFSYYASEIKNQVDTFYDDQHKWLEDHLLGVQDTFANIKQKKRGTRAAMADIIKTPSRKRIQASSKKKITQPEPLRFEQSGTSDRATVSMKSLPPSKIEKSQTGINFIPAFGSSKRHDEKENPAGSLVPSKAHYDLHSAASDRFATSHNKEVTPSVLGEVQNVSHLHNSRQEPSASNSGSTSRDQTSRVFQPIIAPTLLKGLGLSSSTQMSQTYTASGASHHGILNQEEVAALSKSYSSPFKKSTLANPPSSVTLTQPFVTSQSVPGSTSVDRVAKDDEPSARKVVVYTTTSLQHPTVDGDCDEETHDHSGEDTELEEEALEGHELSAIQEGEEEEDPAATERHIPRGSAKKTRKEEQPNPNIHTTAQKAKISLPKPTNPSQPTSRGSSDRSPQVTSDSIALQPAAKLSKSLKSVPDLHVEPDAAFEDSVREDTAPLQAAVASLHDTLPKSQDDTILAQEDLAHHRDRVTPSEDIHDTAVEASVDQEVVHETNAVHSSPNRDNVAKYRSDLPESSRAPALSSCESHPQRQRERDNSHSLPIEHKDLHEDSHAPTSDAKAVHTIPDAPECRNQKITSPERPQAIPTSQALKTSKPAVSRSSKTTTALAEHVSTPEADEEPLAETNDVQSERLQFSLPDQNITAEIPLNDDPSRLRNTRAIQSQAFDNNTRTPGPTTQSLFTPGNTRAALIHSPQSQWSSKPTNSGWLNKPHKTPGLAYGALGLGIEKSEVSRFQGVGGSPVATNKPDPRPSFTSHATNLARAQDIGSQANTISDSQRMLANQRRSSKRTSTDAGFPYTSETQEAKIARPYVPVPHRYVPSTADKGKKGVDDLKNRLSKIQRESAMHERTQQVLPMVEPLHMVQRASLATSATSASVVHGKPLIAQSSQTSHSTSTMPPWAPMPPWNAADLNNLNKSQSSRPPASQISSQHRTVSPASLPSFTTYAGVPLIDRGASSETTHSLHNKASNPPVGLYADSTDSQLPVKKTSVGDLVAAYESKKKPDEPAVNVSSVARNTSPAPSVTLTHETKSKSPVDTAPLNIKSTALLRSTTPTATPPVLRVDKEARRIVTQPEIPKDDAQGAMEKESQDGGSAVSEHYEKDLIDLNDRDEQVENEDSLSDCSELSPSASNFQDAYASAPSQSSRHASNAGNVTPPLDEGTEARTPPTSGIMSVFKAGAALATSWTSTKKPELKSLQLAAVAAKKELDDKERKNAIKEEREQRRLALLEKKQAEEREKEEADRKARAAEADRKKKEREESSKARQTVKAKPAPAATPGHHRDVSSAGDLAKKRKVEADTSRVMDPKKAKPQKPEPISPARVAPGSALKTSSSSSFQPSRVAPAAPAAPGSVKSLNKYRVAAASVGVKTMIEPIKITHPTPASSSSKAFQPARQSKLPKPSVAGSSKSKLSAVAPPAALKPNAPSATPKINPTDPKGKKKSEEYVELPDIDSEYSDDDEEEHQRKEAALPDWAQTMVIKDALANQRKMNPNDIFGTTIPAPPMEG
ncbi:uncharacterized protein MELLADRAFT_59364 [Melampsora larici-populina 98AG31]|uniref:Inner centromere protein ARK-binding domain-containing protein n=1 Tax=Melampsora larici-populina (strain 98AG31 / pathotype 3-4-7) TaxID=747676 RepID=F4R617_MELLP|nr:uncharacterized protein MELLADRAFT_59364 [Melampsora larici-populina 98AG31]EGG12162.1 hypothetical protein MELLADRAFT_59364 [Melampsora larici-populina 98AG31]